MDWKQILSKSPRNLSDLEKDEIYEELMLIKRDSIDKKYQKKLFDLMQYLLKYKGDMVNTLLSDLELLALSSKDLGTTSNIIKSL